MMYHRMNRKKRSQPQESIPRICDVEGCTEPGEYKAPRTRGGNDRQYYYFCLEHIREFNKGYNFFEGMSDDDVQAFMKEAVTGHRPTWTMGQGGGRFYEAELERKLHDMFHDIPTKPINPAIPEPVSKALHVLDLSHPVEIAMVKAAYKKLAKQYHPDMNKDEAAPAKFCEITASYNVLIEYYKAV